MNPLTAVGSFFTSVLGFFAEMYTRKIALITSYVAGTTFLFVGMATVINNLLAGIAYAVPAWASAGAIFLPSNLAACISALITARLTKWAFVWTKERYEKVTMLAAC